MANLRASIDIGSNSILLLIVDLDANFKVIANESNVTGLGRDLDINSEFLENSMEESFKVLETYVDICKKQGIQANDIIATATEASRVAKNSKSFFEKVLSQLGLKVTLLTGEGEAFYSTTGILFNTTFNSDIIHIMDIGGASTEIIKVDVKSEKIIDSFSMPFGAVRVTNWIENNDFKLKIDQVYKEFHDKLKNMKTSSLHCVAGTMTSVANIQLNNEDFKELEVHGHSFSVEEIKKMHNKFSQLNPGIILKQFPFLGKRSNTIKGGIVVALKVIEWLEVEEVTISTYGLRYGTLIKGGIEDEFVFRQ